MLDQEDLEDFSAEVEEYRQRRSWSTDTELLAKCVDLLAGIASKLDAGVAVGMVPKLRQPKQRKPVVRPDWVREQQRKQSGGDTVMHPRDFIRHIQQK